MQRAGPRGIAEAGTLTRYRKSDPPGSKFATPEGARRLREELDRLWRVERPQVTKAVQEAAAQGDRSENAEYIYGKKRLREIDRRLNFLGARLKNVVVVDPAKSAGKEQVFFGATVDVEDEDGVAQTWHVVGEDEVDPASGRVSWRSPLGRALLKKRAGDVTVYARPDGAKIELTVTDVRYGA